MATVYMTKKGTGREVRLNTLREVIVSESVASRREGSRMTRILLKDAQRWPNQQSGSRWPFVRAQGYSLYRDQSLRWGKDGVSISSSGGALCVLE